MYKETVYIIRIRIVAAEFSDIDALPMVGGGIIFVVCMLIYLYLSVYQSICSSLVMFKFGFFYVFFHEFAFTSTCRKNTLNFFN